MRDARADLDAKHVAVVGISPDAPAQQNKFHATYDLGFPLLSDPEHHTAEQFGTWGEKKMYGKVYMGIIRSAFLIDPEGMIVQAWYKISPKNTVPELMKVLSG